MTSNLIIISGADRVGKSTLAEQLSRTIGGKVYHFGPPDRTQKNIFTRYREPLPEGITIWDRSYVCGHILERFRENNHSHIGSLLELEIWLNNHVDSVLHVGVVRKWCEVAALHLEEIEGEMGADDADWYRANLYLGRLNEHRFYYQELFEFYDHVTLFPSLINPTIGHIKSKLLAPKQTGYHYEI